MAANGTPIVKIATPNDRGVSHNRYTDFNVDDRNLILNNSDRITRSLLGGYIDGNGNLKRSGSASLILNEVTGSNASLLRGYVEVAGAPAQLVLANANGIACEGCGFINTPWVTLAAGTPLIDATGRVSGYRVGAGTLSVGAAGLDAREARLDLFARAIQLNAGVYADQINGTFGAGDVGAGEDGTIVVTANPLGARPAFGLDVAALGGMYARSIRLVGTEAGLGVRVDGTLASLDGGLTLDSQGGVRVGGTVTSGAGATLKGTDVGVAGTVYAEGPLAVTAGFARHERPGRERRRPDRRGPGDRRRRHLRGGLGAGRHRLARRHREPVGDRRALGGGAGARARRGGARRGRADGGGPRAGGGRLGPRRHRHRGGRRAARGR